MKMLVVMLSAQKLGNFDRSVVYTVKGTSNLGGCVARDLQSILTFSLHFVPKSG
jgi:hypothetical protein